MKTRKIITKSIWETQKFAKEFAQFLTREFDSRVSLVIGFFGDLGAGKTVFCQGFAKGLGISRNIHSPTFVILKTYKLQANSYKLIHIDAYRLQNPKELLDLGWNELIQNPNNIILIEWADRIKKILPQNYIQVKLKHICQNKREITIKAKITT